MKVPNPALTDLRKIYGDDWPKFADAQLEVEDIDLALDEYEEYHHWELEKDLKRRLQALKPILPEGARILDVGCGAGHFGKAADCFDVIGVDPTSLALADATEFPMLPFDAVVMFHSFEHFREPISELRRAYECLKPNGYLIIETPNRDGYLWGLPAFRKWQEERNGDRHLIVHSATSLIDFVKAGGFLGHPLGSTCFQFNRYGFANLLRWSGESKPGGHLTVAGQIFDKRMDAELERCLAKVGMCDTLWLVARK